MRGENGAYVMARWLRFELDDRLQFGTLQDGVIQVFLGDMFAGATATDRVVQLSDARVRTPTDPSKMICLWNNFYGLAARLGSPVPDEPLYLLKAPSAFIAHGDIIRRPKSYDGKVVYEGELGIVVGRRCSYVSEAEAPGYIFGYTCINDVTAADLINTTPAFPQWTRAKSFDTFGAFGPVIATDLDPMTLRVRTILNGEERQNYPVSDMIFQPARLVSLISKDLTLLSGDIIACGTSIGVGTMKNSTNTVEVSIQGVGTLSNIFAQ
jgi:2-keto-4-pentenoate hydratase/2-oxohepta-3-ene-1,7-dioic acid hydratase in catechol pathway